MRKLVWFAVPFAVAVLLYVYCLSLLWGLVFAGASLLALTVVLLSKWRRRLPAGLALGGLCFGFLFCALYEQLLIEPLEVLDGETVSCSATVCDYAEEARFGSRVPVELTVNGRPVKTLLYLKEDGGKLAPGDVLTLSAELSRADRTRQGEETLYQEAHGIRLLAYARSEATVAKASSISLRFWPQVFSHALCALLQKALPEEASGLICALLTGGRSGLRYTQETDLQMAGLSHVVAVSGMHVSILLGFLSLLTGRRRYLTALLCVPLVLFFVAAAGGSPSVVRAAVMQIFFLLAPLLKREPDAPTSLCAALLLLLLVNPYAIANVSLQLSFGAMAGMLLATGPIYRKLVSLLTLEKAATETEAAPADPFRLRYRLVRFLCANLSATLGALLFTVPLSALHFGTFSVYAVLANLLVLTAVALCFSGGIVCALLAAVWLPLGQAFGWVLAWPARYVLWVAKGIARLPFAQLTTASPYLVIWLLVSYLVLALAIYRRKALLPTVGILAGLLLTVFLTWLDARPNQFSITMLDVGQGQCLLLRTRDCTLLYDCGGSDGDRAGQHAAEMLLATGVERIDAVILSHYDEDHCGGLAQLLYRIEVGTLYSPAVQNAPNEAAEVLALAAEHAVPVEFVTEETTLPFSGGAARILPPGFAADGNAESLSLLFSCAEYAMLATGDLDELGEALLLRQYALPDVDLFVAGHHGSKHSSSAALLEMIAPETVLISVGYNRYGHPSEEALARFAAVGAAVYRTDECGDITIRR